MTNHHVFLVAFTVEGGECTREEAEGLVAEKIGGILPYHSDAPAVTSYWFAEDDRTDGSDCDSAVFVHPGCQHMASRTLVALGFSGEQNLQEWDKSSHSRFDGKQV